MTFDDFFLSWRYRERGSFPSPQIWELTTATMFGTIPISKLIHFHAYVSSIFIAHDTVTAIEMIFDGDSISNIQNCIRASFNNNSNSFMTWYKSYTMASNHQSKS